QLCSFDGDPDWRASGPHFDGLVPASLWSRTVPYLLRTIWGSSPLHELVLAHDLGRESRPAVQSDTIDLAGEVVNHDACFGDLPRPPRPRHHLRGRRVGSDARGSLVRVPGPD